MNTQETVVHLGQLAGSKLCILDEETVNKSLPYFSIDKQRNVACFHYQHHDNADRMLFIKGLLENYILKSIDCKFNLEGFYNIELHDTYSYLTNSQTYNNCLVWSKRKQDHHVVLMPDLYQIANYNGALAKEDPYKWNEKSNRACFFGTTTGNTNPLVNERIQCCLWAKDKSFCDMYITKVAQIPVQELIQKIPNFNDIIHPPVSPLDMFKYKYLVDIPGNTCSWDRVPTILNSRSLLLKMPCNDMCWYYPLLHDTEHYVETTKEKLQEHMHFFDNNQHHAQSIITRANMFVKHYLTQSNALLYMKSMFEQAAHLSGR